MLNELVDAKVVLFGAGNNGNVILKNLLNNGIKPAYFVDNDQSKEYIESTNSIGWGGDKC